MRGMIPDYTAKTPATLAEALLLLQDKPSAWKILAGGTDLMVLLEMGALPEKNLLNLWGLKELRGIEASPDRLIIRSLTTFREIKDHPIIQKEFPILAQAAAQVGAIAIQNRATIGGNIANASPAADSPPALLVYDAKIELISQKGSRVIPYRDFHTGYKKTALSPGELIGSIVLTRGNAPKYHFYRKIGTRSAQSISKVSFACATNWNGSTLQDFRLALGSVAPTVVRCGHTETALQGKSIDSKTLREAKAALQRDISPITDVRSSSEYRMRVTLNLLEDFLLSLKRGAHVELGH